MSSDSSSDFESSLTMENEEETYEIPIDTWNILSPTDIRITDNNIEGLIPGSSKKEFKKLNEISY